MVILTSNHIGNGTERRPGFGLVEMILDEALTVYVILTGWFQIEQVGPIELAVVHDARPARLRAVTLEQEALVPV